MTPIERSRFARFVRDRFEGTDKGIDDEALGRLLDATLGHPYATQELAYEVWQTVPTGFAAHAADVEAGLEKVLRSEHNHFEKLWDDAPVVQRRLMAALAEEPTPAPYGEDFRAAHDLPAASTLQSALRALERKEVAARTDEGVVTIVEPFFADWVRREQRFPSLRAQLRLDD